MKCKHEIDQSCWVYAPTNFIINPPVYRKICKYCLQEEAEIGKYIDFSEYWELKEKKKRLEGL